MHCTCPISTTRLLKMAVAVDQCGFNLENRPPRCNRKSFTQLDFNMLDLTQSELSQTLEHAFNLSFLHKSVSTPCLSRTEEDSSTNPRIDVVVGPGSPQIHALAAEVVVALAAGANPEPASSGLGGAYFLRAPNGDKIAVAKPIDEEPLALNNPKGLTGRMLGQPGMKDSIRIGETGIREAAAYLLDHDSFAGVPPTALVKFSHVKFNSNSSGPDVGAPPFKIASVQRFVEHDSDAGDLGPSSFSEACVHGIGILDARLMNLDRHAGNILVRQGARSYGSGKADLVPIDHGFCLPEYLDDPYFEWLHWPQASVPFTEAEVDYISSLDPFKDADTLRVEVPSMRESSIRVLVLCTIFLKRATAHGLCLADIGEMMTRDFHGGEENWSELEKLCLNAKASLNKRVTYTNAVEEGADGTIFPVDKSESDLADGCFDSNTILENSHKGISFGEMVEDKWRSFLEIFEELLPKAFEERKSVSFSKA